MNLFGKEVNNRYALWVFLHILIIIDIILISTAMFFNLPADIARNIQIFDFCICIILLIEWGVNFYISKPKKIFLKQKSNWVDLIASIPFDVILPAVIPSAGLLRYLRLLKLLRVIALFNWFFNGLEKFLKTTNLDKILGGVFFIILIFTLLLYIYGPTYDLFDDFYFVIVTLTTVGYGDITPQTLNEKVISILLIFIGIFIFSTITGAISSFLTDRLISDEDIENKLDGIQDELKEVKDDLRLAHEENKWLIIDEINRADIDKSFGQLFTVLSGQNVELPYSIKNLGNEEKSIKIKLWEKCHSDYVENEATYYIGKNWRIIATMNSYDKNSLFDLSYAFMRRFTFIEIEVPKNFKELIELWTKNKNLKELIQSTKKFRDKLESVYSINYGEESKVINRQIGPAIFLDIIKYLNYRLDIEGNNEYDDKILSEAINAFIIPQFEGLSREKLDILKEFFINKVFDDENNVKSFYNKLNDLKPFY